MQHQLPSALLRRLRRLRLRRRLPPTLGIVAPLAAVTELPVSYRMRKNMSVSRAIKQRTLRAALPFGVLGLVFVSACVDDQPGIVENEAGAASAGKKASAGSANEVAGNSS